MADYDTDKPEFDDAKRYRYTWPGQAPRVVGGAAMRQIVKGADPALLAIEEAATEADIASEREAKRSLRGIRASVAMDGPKTNDE